MSKKTEGAVICDGMIDTERIAEAHSKVKGIVDSYAKVSEDVFRITEEILQNWVGDGRNEFESQYNMLIKKIQDFGDTLQDIYSGLVDAEAEYEGQDDSLRQDFVKAVEGE